MLWAQWLDIPQLIYDPEHILPLEQVPVTLLPILYGTCMANKLTSIHFGSQILICQETVASLNLWRAGMWLWGV